MREVGKTVMERFRRFFGCKVVRSQLDDVSLLEQSGLEARYLPEAFDEFDEMEFLLPWEEDRKIVLSAALEQEKIMRILFGWIGPGDPEDAMRKLEEEDLKKVLAEKGPLLLAFLESITQPG